MEGPMVTARGASDSFSSKTKEQPRKALQKPTEAKKAFLPNSILNCFSFLHFWKSKMASKEDEDASHNSVETKEQNLGIPTAPLSDTQASTLSGDTALGRSTAADISSSSPAIIDLVDRSEIQLSSPLYPCIAADPYAWPIKSNGFSPANTALIIIDMQKDFCSPTGYLASQNLPLDPILTIIPRISTLLDLFRQHHFPIYHTREGHRPDLSTLSHREYHRSRNNPSSMGIGSMGPLGRLLIRGEPGHDIIPELYPLRNEPVIDKPGRSAFAYTELELMLRIRGIRNLILCGVTTDVCVSSTMRDGNERGFDCVLVGDATESAGEELRDAVCEGVKLEGGIFGAVCTTNDVVSAMEKGPL